MKHLLLLIATTTTLLHVFAPTTNAIKDDNTVYDVYGEPLQAGQNYYLVPYEYKDDIGGGLTWEMIANLFSIQSLTSCSTYYVTQLKKNTNYGEPIAIYPTNVGQNIVSLSSQVNIAFSNSSLPSLPGCPSVSNVWKVANNRVVLGGTMGAYDVTSLFTIKELDDGGYKISFCRRIFFVFIHCDDQDLGIVSNDPHRRLGFNNDNPLAFVFEPEQSPFLQKA